MGINFVTLAGYVGSEPKVYDNKTYKSVRLSVCTVGYRAKKEVTDWHNVEAYNNNASYIEKYIFKGDYVVISGYLSITEYKGNDGNEKKVYSVKVSSIEKPRIKEKETGQKPASENYNREYNFTDDDLPY